MKRRTRKSNVEWTGEMSQPTSYLPVTILEAVGAALVRPPSPAEYAPGG